MSDSINVKDICGLIWRETAPDSIVYSVKINGTLGWVSIPDLTEKLHETAKEKGWSLGKLVDWINQKITAEELRRNPPLFSFTTQLTDEQAVSFSKMFGLDYTPASVEQRADTIDGTAD